MSKQVICRWTPSPSGDVDYQELRLVIQPSQPGAVGYGPVKLNRLTDNWSTKETGVPLLEGDEIEVTISTIDTSGLRDSNPPTRRFVIPAIPPDGASDLSFEVLDFADGDEVPADVPVDAPTDSSESVN
jgi:hypothetical protein